MVKGIYEPSQPVPESAESNIGAITTAFNQTNVSIYFDNLYSIMEKYKFNSSKNL